MGKIELRDWLAAAAGVALRRMDEADGAGQAGDAAVALEQERRLLDDELFGRGYLLPGGEAEVMRLVRPLHFGAGARLMVAGAGVAGPCRALADQLGVFVAGYERAPALVREHAVALDAAGQMQRLRIVPWLPAEGAGVGLPTAEYHHGLVMNATGGLPVEQMLAGIVGAIRPGGQLILLECVSTPQFDPGSALARDWMRRDGRQDRPVAVQELSRVLARLGVQIRATDDMSPAHARLAVYDWRRVVDAMAGRPNDLRCQVLLDQAENWAARERLMAAGQIRMMRWHALMPGSG